MIISYGTNPFLWIDPLGYKCDLAKQGEDLYVDIYR